MTDVFSDKQKSELRQLLDQPLLQEALQHALSDVWRSLSGASTLEGAALAYKHQEGATAVITKLYALVDIKRDLSVTPRKLRHTPVKP